MESHGEAAEPVAVEMDQCQDSDSDDNEEVEGDDNLPQGSDSSSYDSEEEVEPKLCYERLMNDVPKILMNDAASCLAVHPKFIALGTHLGVIHILDHQGNNIRSKELLLHVTTVNQISIDEKGDYIASCSNDGKVVIHGLSASELNTSVTIERPVRAIALDPNFYKGGRYRRFIVGEDRVVLYEHYILSRYKPTVLYLGEGPIRNIQWRDTFVAWASDKTLRVYDISANKIITVIRKEHDPKLVTELYRCNLFWKDDRTLLVGWADSVKVCTVVSVDQQVPGTFAMKDQTVPYSSYVEITSIFNPNFCVCGISSLGDAIVVLAVSKPSEGVDKEAQQPQLHVLEPHREDFTTISCDTLILHGYQQYKCNDYHLESLAEEGLYYIVSLKDFVIAKPRNEDDHIAWLLEHEMFEEGITAAKESKSLERHTILGVGQRYLDHLLKQEKFDEAAHLCSTIFGSNKQLWEDEVYKFAQIRQLRSVAPYLPLDDPLGPAIYEMVLNAFLQDDPKGFLNLIKKWPCKVYNIPTVISAVQERLTLVPIPELRESLCELYILDKRYDKALNDLIEIKSKSRVFELIKNNKLFGSIHDKLEVLMELDPSVASDMLVENMDKVPIDLVIGKLKKQNLLYEYLSKVFQRDPTMCEEHHGLLVELYAEYAPEQLLRFLRSSNNYPLEHALDICKQRSLFQEVVFLLGRMGNTRQALEQITKQLQDINQAIEFCKEHDDKELWEYLIQCSLDKSGFITVLLQNIGTYVDPIMLIRKIPAGMEIPGLRDSLVKILQDYNLQISLREGCKKILVSDFVSLFEKLHKQQTRGILISEDQVCQACHRKLLANDIRSARDILVFNCRHAFHEDCLPVHGMETCSMCSAQKRGPGSSFLVK